VRHITADRVDTIEPMLDEIRACSGLVEKGPGRFYRKSQAFLHFHEDGDDIFADVRLQPGPFERVRVTTKAEQRRLVTRIRRCLEEA
jgi:hypothetical protein